MNKTIYSRQSECVRKTLIALRTEAGFTQRQLAGKLERERSLIGRLELGERRLDMVEFFGCVGPVNPIPRRKPHGSCDNSKNSNPKPHPKNNVEPEL